MVLLYNMENHSHYSVINIMENKIFKKLEKVHLLWTWIFFPAYNVSVDIQNSLSLIVIFQAELLLIKKVTS